MSDRLIELGKRTWKNLQQQEWPWYTSAKGNDYTKVGERTVVIVHSKYKPGFLFTVSPKTDDEKWSYSALYETVEEAKAAALASLGVGVVRTPVPPVEKPPEAEPPMRRKIVL